MYICTFFLLLKCYRTFFLLHIKIQMLYRLRQQHQMQMNDYQVPQTANINMMVYTEKLGGTSNNSFGLDLLKVKKLKH